jgi:hypothetical protein
MDTSPDMTIFHGELESSKGVSGKRLIKRLYRAGVAQTFVSVPIAWFQLVLGKVYSLARMSFALSEYCLDGMTTGKDCDVEE